MCKNVILSTAINAVIGLPRKALWATTAVTAVFSLDAGLAIIGDTLDLKAVGTAQVHAAPGLLENRNAANLAFGLGVTVATTWLTAAASVLNPVDPVGTTVGGSAGAVTDPVIYASEIFRGAASALPDTLPGGTLGSDSFQAVCYQIAGTIDQQFSVEFKMTGAEFSTTVPTAPGSDDPWIFGVLAGTPVGAALNQAGCDLVPTPNKASMKLTVDAAVSCTLGDGAQICLIYKISGSSASALKVPGTIVTIDATVKKGSSTIVGQAAPITVAQSAQGANFSLATEADGEVYIASSSGNKEFTSTGTAGAVNADDDNAFISGDQVKIGYILYSAGDAKGVNGSTAFALGGAGTGDAATLVITNGQFSASPGGASAGRVFLGGVTDAVATIDSTAGWTATWNLTDAQLGQIIAASIAAVPAPTPIMIKVDSLTAIDSGVDTDPEGTLKVTMGTAKTPISDEPIVSSLRRIPYDGKVCKVFNIPSPDGAADVLSLRITNDSDQIGKITGTLYNEAGEIQGEVIDLLAGHIDYTKSPPVDRATLGLTDPLQLQSRETVILTSKNIATAFGQTSWAGERWVLEIQSSIPRIEVFNLLRNVENIMLQPLSNVSTSAKGVECSPIP